MDFAEKMRFLQQLEPSLITELAPTNYAEAKEEFLANPELRTPNFVYGNSRRKFGYNEEGQICDSAIKIFGGSSLVNGDQYQVLLEYVNHILDTLHLLRDMQDYREESDLGKDHNVYTVGTIRKLNRELYGEIDCETYRALLGREVAMQRSRDLDRRDALALSEILDKYEVIEPKDAKLFIPKLETVRAFGELCQSKWQRSFDRVVRSKEYDADDVADLLREIIYFDLPAAKSFQVVVNKDRQSLCVRYKQHLIEFPARRAKGPYTTNVLLRTVIGHELMTHVMRTAWAEENCSEVAVPLAGYNEFEEGLARAVEQGLQQMYYPAGAWHYIAIGMAELDQADFREVFQVQRTLRFLKMVDPRHSEAAREERWQEATDQAFQCTMRCFRGTGDIPLRKDLMYFNGQQRVWRLIEKHISERPEELYQSLFESGKTDITNANHRSLLESLGISRIA